MRTLQTRKRCGLKSTRKKSANGERPAKATQRRAKSSEKKKGVETGRRVSSVKTINNKTVMAKTKAQSRPRIARASKDEVVKHNRLVTCSSHVCPTPSFLDKQLPAPYQGYVVSSFYAYDNHRGIRRMVGLKHKYGMVKATSYARFIYQIVHGKLDRSLHVDHIDNDPLNDSLHNLQAISQTENNRKTVKHLGKFRQMLDIKCYICGTVFSIFRNRTYAGGHPGIVKTCGRQCGGKLSALRLTDSEKIKIFNKSIIKEYRTDKIISNSK